jgi:hypothetical protein
VGRQRRSNNRQSTSWGDGVYKSTDGGKTYTSSAKTSQHINRIVIDPRNNDIVFVAATARCSDRAAIAASSRRPTAARRGSRC